MCPAATSSLSDAAPAAGTRNFVATSTRDTLAIDAVRRRRPARRRRGLEPGDAVADDRAASGRGTPTPRPAARRGAGSSSAVADLVGRLVRAVDQVDAVRRVAEARLEPVDGLRRCARATARRPRRCRASRPGSSPRRSRPSRCRWPSPRSCTAYCRPWSAQERRVAEVSGRERRQVRGERAAQSGAGAGPPTDRPTRRGRRRTRRRCGRRRRRAGGRRGRRGRRPGRWSGRRRRAATSRAGRTAGPARRAGRRSRLGGSSGAVWVRGARGVTVWKHRPGPTEGSRRSGDQGITHAHLIALP